MKQEDKQFFNFLAKMIDPSRKAGQPRERYGRPAIQKQIDLAEASAKKLEVSPPKHLYQHHVSLCGWIWANMSR